MLERRRLGVRASPQDALRCLRGERMPFALIGDWAGSRAVLGSEPVVERLESLDELDLARADGGAVLGRGRVATTTQHGSADRGAAGAGRAPGATRPGAGSGAVGGGWFGWLGFGAGALVDRFPVEPPRVEPLERLGMAFYDHVLRLDRDGVWWFEALITPGRRAALAERHRELEARLRRTPERLSWHAGELAPAPPGYAGHLLAVERCLESIRAGEIFQANVCLRLEGRLEGSSLDAFAAASERLRPARGAYFQRGEQALLSLSPELFLGRRGRDVATAPIKGTLPRAAGAAPDDPQRARLRDSAKAQAENVMIVDLMRNDLGRVCEPGSIRAELPPVAEPHPGVWHLVSPVSGRLREGVGDAALIRASFPPGSVTGAPKLQAIEVIARLEAGAREVYTGAIGFVSPLAGLELSVAIRSFEMRGGRLWLGSGGGIVADSEPRAELDEALDKARPLAAALGAGLAEPPAGLRASAPARRAARLHGALERPDPAHGLLETIAVEGGEPVRLDSHLERLAASMRRLYGEQLTASAASEVRAAATGVTGGRGRVRLIVRPRRGASAIEYQPLPAGGPLPGAALLEPALLPGGLGAHKWADRRFLAAFAAAGTEPLLLDGDGAVLEAGSANVWILERGRLLTPPADGRILPGVSRSALLSLERAAGVEMAVERFTIERLEQAEAILLSSSVRLVRAAGLGGRQPDRVALELSAELRGALGVGSASGDAEMSARAAALGERVDHAG